tara:strand:- start:5246 stop:6184 length:939 start_codon:yes stop_codon:yes gene_type:complete
MLEPLVTVIVPIYNVEKFLHNSLKSVQNQSYKNFECLCINDGSPDNSIDIIKAFTKDTRFKLIDKKNEGVGATRNLGIKEAKGDYICFLDSDDCYHPEFLSTLVKGIIENDVDFASSSFTEVPEDFNYNNFSHKTFKTNSLKFDNPIKDYFRKDVNVFVTIWNKLYKKDLVKDMSFVKDIHPAEDDIFTFQCLLKSKTFSYNKAELVYYRQREDSVTKSFNVDNAYISSKIIAKIFLDANAGKFQKVLDIKASRRIFWDIYTRPYKFYPEGEELYIERLIEAEKENLINRKHLSLNKRFMFNRLLKKYKKGY